MNRKEEPPYSSFINGAAVPPFFASKFHLYILWMKFRCSIKNRRYKKRLKYDGKSLKYYII